LFVLHNFLQSLRQTFVGVAKQTGWTALGTVAGGLLVGPLGALVGGVIGATYGYTYSNDYDSESGRQIIIDLLSSFLKSHSNT
uniref:Gly-zipper_Omp domain-containing protein n=1 Tax=Angiostrongylus cantonensis TaxID=6313 RepID=A0A0K0D5L6_ANGCA